MRRSRCAQHYFALSGFIREERKELCRKITSLRGEYSENAVSYVIIFSVTLISLYTMLLLI